MIDPQSRPDHRIANLIARFARAARVPRTGHAAPTVRCPRNASRPLRGCPRGGKRGGAGGGAGLRIDSQAKGGRRRFRRPARPTLSLGSLPGDRPPSRVSQWDAWATTVEPTRDGAWATTVGRPGPPRAWLARPAASAWAWGVRPAPPLPRPRPPFRPADAPRSAARSDPAPPPTGGASPCRRLPLRFRPEAAGSTGPRPTPAVLFLSPLSLRAQWASGEGAQRMSGRGRNGRHATPGRSVGRSGRRRPARPGPIRRRGGL
jgi:hypothetical protein